MQVYIDDLRFISGDSIDGDIFLRLGDVFFPEYKWFDLVSSVLEMWSMEICSFCLFQKNTIRLSFMDGPFFALVQRRKGEVVAGLYEAGKLVQPEQIIDCNYFITELICAFNALVRFAELNHPEWHSLRSVIILRQALHVIKKQ